MMVKMRKFSLLLLLEGILPTMFGVVKSHGMVNVKMKIADEDIRYKWSKQWLWRAEKKFSVLW